MRLVQVRHAGGRRAVGVVDGGLLRLLASFGSVCAAAREAITSGRRLADVTAADAGSETLPYDSVYGGESEWKLLPPLDHPEEPSRCLVSGTGLTHRKGAENRDAMHASGGITDSMRMYRWGEEGGRPGPGAAGVQPEWFYKGDGSIVRAHGEPLEVPGYAEDGGEEPEVAGLYVIAPDGAPCRVGFAQGNEFSDHVMERRNYLYLAPSKLRACALGPELVVGGGFEDVRGAVRIEREGRELWSAPVQTGEAHMVHSLANLEHHHFKYEAHRRPGSVHVHFFGTGAFSFGAGVSLEDGDVMEVAMEDMGRPLRNPLRVADRDVRPAAVVSL